MGTVSGYEDDVLNRPAVGVLATEGNTDAVVRVVARARNQGHAVFVAYAGGEEPPSVRFARQLGAETVTLEHEADEAPTDDADDTVLRRLLSTVAQIHGFSGLMVHSSPEEYIDYEKSQELFVTGSEYTVSAPTQSQDSGRSNEALVAIPAYNEASTIGEIVRNVHDYVDTVLVIDDGSTDNTASVARAAGAEVVEHDRNRGYGAALKTAFVEARDRGVTQLVTLDGDGQHEVSDLNRLLDAQEESDAEVVIGSRFTDDVTTDVPRYRRFGLLVVNLLTNLSLGVVRSESRISDTQSGFRAYDRTAIESLAEDPSLGDQMSISTDILYHAQQREYRIEEVGTVIDYDVENGSSVNPISHGYVLVMNLINTIEQTRPLMSLALPGFVVTFVGLAFSYLGVLHYMRLQEFPTGEAIVSAFLILIGLFACFSGIILHSLNKYFESTPHVNTGA